MIGTAVARIANGFSMKVIAYDPCCTSSEVPVTFVSLDDLLRQADVVSLHVPLNATTKHMLNRESMKQCKQGSYLINTARGGVIETAALIELLENNILAGVALDVLEEEFFTHHLLALLRSTELTREECKVVMENRYLMQHPRVIISPHNAFNSKEALDRSMKETVTCIEAWKKTV
jgi:D-lactate dehydrogenase